MDICKVVGKTNIFLNFNQKLQYQKNAMDIFKVVGKKHFLIINTFQLILKLEYQGNVRDV